MKATEDQAIWAWWTLMLGTAGTVAIFITVYFTLRAAGAAERSADNAVEQTEMIRAEYASTHRPRIILREATVNSLIEGKVIEVRLAFANVGETTAKIAIARIGIESVDEASQRLLTNTDAEDFEGIFGKLIKPGEQFLIIYGDRNHSLAWNYEKFGEILRTTVSDSKLKFAVDSPMFSVHLFGQIGYRDESNVLRRTSFRRHLRSSRQRFYALPDNYEPDLDYTD